MPADIETSKTGVLIRSLRATRAETIRRFGAVESERLAEPREWRGAQASLRHLLAYLTEGSESRRIQILGMGRLLNRPRLTDAQHALGIACEARGRLIGTLLGVPDELFDRPPAAQEWSLRQVLGHVIAVDERYRIAAEHAASRALHGGEGPIRPPEDSLPPPTGEATSGGAPAELLERAQTVHDSVVRSLAQIPDNLLEAPTNWGAWDVDLRFRLHRFAAHDREHSIQIRKTLQALSFVPTEPQLLLADTQAELGALEATLVAIGDEFIDRRLPSGGRSIAQTVEGLIEEERAL